MNETHDCPICAAPVGHWERYPNQVCDHCANKTCDETGRPVSYIVFSLAGGLVGTYDGTGERYTSPVCYIDGVKCTVGEHRFGGVVVEVCKD